MPTVKLTTSLIEKKCLHQLAQKSLTKELKTDHLKKLTHLFMNEKSIGIIVSNYLTITIIYYFVAINYKFHYLNCRVTSKCAKN